MIHKIYNHTYNDTQYNQKNIKEAVKLSMVCISCNNGRHPVPKNFTLLHFISLHLTTLVDTSLLPI